MTRPTKISIGKVVLDSRFQANSSLIRSTLAEHLTALCQNRKLDSGELERISVRVDGRVPPHALGEHIAQQVSAALGGDSDPAD
ncbi:MAG: hypothetical protein HN348_24555 [Proteobacteria bacterium]|jgi:hypothetical protein|nr:hypothetical protein [Pseudomonadota bacterium]